MEMNEVNSSSRDWSQDEDNYYDNPNNISEGWILKEFSSDFNYNLTSTVSKANSRVRRQVPSLLLVNGYDPLEIIRAYHEDVDQLMIVATIIFLLVVLVLPLLFTADYLHNSGHEKVDSEPRGSKIAPPEEDIIKNVEQDRDTKNQNGRQFIQTANQSTQLALEDGDDLMQQLDPEELEFTVIARPRRFSVVQQSQPYEPSHLNLKTKPSHLSLSHAQKDENTVTPLLFQVPSTLQKPNEMDQEAQPPNPEPVEYKEVAPPMKKVKVEKQTRPPDPEPPKSIKEEEQQTQQVDLEPSKSATAYQAVPAPTAEITHSLPHIVDGEVKGPVMKSRYKPTDPNLRVLTVPKPPEVDSEHVSTQTSRTKLQTLEILQPPVKIKPKKKCRDKVKDDVSGNSKCVEKRVQDPCACPSGFIHTKFKDLTWGQMFQYAMADGGWYFEDETPAPVVDNQIQNPLSSANEVESTVTITPRVAKKEGDQSLVAPITSQGTTSSIIRTDEGNRSDYQGTDKPTPIPTFNAGADKPPSAPVASSSTSPVSRIIKGQEKQAKSKATKSRSSASQ